MLTHRLLQFYGEGMVKRRIQCILAIIIFMINGQVIRDPYHPGNPAQILSDGASSLFDSAVRLDLLLRI